MNRILVGAAALLLALAPVVTPGRGYGGGHSSHGGSHHSSSVHTSSGSHHRASSSSSGAHRSSGSHHSGHGTHRDRDQRAKFMRTHPCPSTGKTHGACPGYVVDHVQALKHGGHDDPSNMQWQTVGAGKAKDRWE